MLFPLDIFAIDFSILDEWANLPFYLLFWQIYKSGGWLIFLIIFIVSFSENWKNKKQNKFAARHKWILLAIDVPRDNEQTPKAVENIFTFFHGVHGTRTWWEKWIKGEFQQYFSVELISLDGYVQFVIWCNSRHRDLVEAAVYAQYPDAEISEIEDYTQNIPTHYPNPEYNCYGSEYKLIRESAYPLKVWRDFEHPGAEYPFKDPMAAVLEALSTLRVGEQFWIQFIVLPIKDSEWKPAGDELVKKLIGARKEKKAPSLFPGIITGFFSAIVGIFIAPGAVEEKKREDPPTLMQHLSPGQADVVKGVERKLAMMGYKCKYRWVYIAKKELYNKDRGVKPYVGALKQFNTANMNALLPDKRTWTNAQYFFKEYRRNLRRSKLVRAYKNRSNDSGTTHYILTVEELASMWHFPMKDIRTPLLSKTEVKKGEPPSDLPVDLAMTLESPFVPATSPQGRGAERAAAAALAARKPQTPIGLPVPEGAAAEGEDIGPPDNLPVA